MPRSIIRTPSAPAPNRLFSQGTRAAGLVFTAQVGLRPDGTLVSDDVAEQTRQSLLNARAVLEAAGARLEDVVQVTVYLTDLADAAAMNAVYETFFPKDPPSRACVQVAALPPRIKVELQVVAAASEKAS